MRRRRKTHHSKIGRLAITLTAGCFVVLGGITPVSAAVDGAADDEPIPAATTTTTTTAPSTTTTVDLGPLDPEPVETTSTTTEVEPVETTSTTTEVEPVETTSTTTEVEPVETTSTTTEVEPVETTSTTTEVEPVETTSTTTEVEPVETTSTTTEVEPVEPSSTTTEVEPVEPSSTTTEVEPVETTSTTTEVEPVEPSSTTTEVEPVEPSSTTTEVEPVEPSSTTTEVEPVEADPINSTAREQASYLDFRMPCGASSQSTVTKDAAFRKTFWTGWRCNAVLFTAVSTACPAALRLTSADHHFQPGGSDNGGASLTMPGRPAFDIDGSTVPKSAIVSIAARERLKVTINHDTKGFSGRIEAVLIEEEGCERERTVEVTASSEDRSPLNYQARLGGCDAADFAPASVQVVLSGPESCNVVEVQLDDDNFVVVNPLRTSGQIYTFPILDGKVAFKIEKKEAPPRQVTVIASSGDGSPLDYEARLGGCDAPDFLRATGRVTLSGPEECNVVEVRLADNTRQVVESMKVAGGVNTLPIINGEVRFQIASAVRDIFAVPEGVATGSTQFLGVRLVNCFGSSSLGAGVTGVRQPNGSFRFETAVAGCAVVRVRTPQGLAVERIGDQPASEANGEFFGQVTLSGADIRIAYAARLGTVGVSATLPDGVDAVDGYRVVLNACDGGTQLGDSNELRTIFTDLLATCARLTVEVPEGFVITAVDGIPSSGRMIDRVIRGADHALQVQLSKVVVPVDGLTVNASVEEGGPLPSGYLVGLQECDASTAVVPAATGATWRFDSLDAGCYTVTIESGSDHIISALDGTRPAVSRLVFDVTEPNQAIEVTLSERAPDTASLTVRAVIATGDLPPNFAVEVKMCGDDELVSGRAASGDFQFNDLEPGCYEVSVDAGEGFLITEANGSTVESEQTADFELTLTEGQAVVADIKISPVEMVTIAGEIKAVRNGNPDELIPAGADIKLDLVVRECGETEALQELSASGPAFELLLASSKCYEVVATTTGDGHKLVASDGVTVSVDGAFATFRLDLADPGAALKVVFVVDPDPSALAPTGNSPLAFEEVGRSIPVPAISQPSDIMADVRGRGRLVASLALATMLVFPLAIAGRRRLKRA